MKDNVLNKIKNVIQKPKQQSNPTHPEKQITKVSQLGNLDKNSYGIFNYHDDEKTKK